MTEDAADWLGRIRRDLAPAHGANLVVPLIERGEAPVEVIARLAAEEQRIVSSDWASFLTLAARSPEPNTRGFFSALAQGEGLVLPMLPALAAVTGMTDAELAAYQPRAGCQGYPSYVARLAMQADPADVVLAILANFDAWGKYCAIIGQALRVHYGFDDDACAFFDFFATPVPELEAQAVAAVQAGLDSGGRPVAAWEHGRLLQAYELTFWNTLV